MREDITIRQETHRDYKDIVSLIEYPLFKNPLSAFGAGARGEISTFLSTLGSAKRKKTGEKLRSLLLQKRLILPG